MTSSGVVNEARNGARRRPCTWCAQLKNRSCTWSVHGVVAVRRMIAIIPLICRKPFVHNGFCATSGGHPSFGDNYANQVNNYAFRPNNYALQQITTPTHPGFYGVFVIGVVRRSYFSIPYTCAGAVRSTAQES